MSNYYNQFQNTQPVINEKHFESYFDSLDVYKTDTLKESIKTEMIDQIATLLNDLSNYANPPKFNEDEIVIELKYANPLNVFEFIHLTSWCDYYKNPRFEICLNGRVTEIEISIIDASTFVFVINKKTIQ